MNLAVQSKLNDAIHALLKLAAAGHQWHLNTRSYAQHMALGELYNYAHEAADALAEKAMGADFQAISMVEQVIKFSPADRAPNEIEAVIAVLGKLETETTKAGMGWLTNEVQGVQGALYGILYKLKRLS